MAPDLFPVHVTVAEDPISYAWKGAAMKRPTLKPGEVVTKEEYEEFGESICIEKFSRW